MRLHIEKLGYKRNFVIYDESEQLGAVKKILSSISAKGEKVDPGAVLAVLSKFKNGGENAKVFADESIRALAQHIAKRYESALHACNAVDFDDLILLTLRLFRAQPDALEACRVRPRTAGAAPASRRVTRGLPWVAALEPLGALEERGGRLGREGRQEREAGLECRVLLFRHGEQLGEPVDLLEAGLGEAVDGPLGEPAGPGRPLGLDQPTLVEGLDHGVEEP